MFTVVFRKIYSIFDGLLDRIFSAGGAVILSQFPRFLNQYTTLLQGALYESERIVERYRQAASLGNKTLESYISKFLNSTDPDFSAQGVVMRDVVNQNQIYKDALEALTNTSIWYKPYAFLRYMDWSLVKTIKFTPGIPLTLEGAVYAFAGLIAGFLLYNVILKSPLNYLGTMRKRKPVQT